MKNLFALATLSLLCTSAAMADETISCNGQQYVSAQWSIEAWATPQWLERSGIRYPQCSTVTVSMEKRIAQITAPAGTDLEFLKCKFEVLGFFEAFLQNKPLPKEGKEKVEQDCREYLEKQDDPVLKSFSRK